MPRTEKSNMMLSKLIADLKKTAHENKAPIWKDIAKRLSKPRRSLAEVNVGRLARHTEKNQVVVIPGKLLGVGDLDFPLTVGALSFSESAKQKIHRAGGTSLSIGELADRHPSGKGVRIIG